MERVEVAPWLVGSKPFLFSTACSSPSDPLTQVKRARLLNTEPVVDQRLSLVANQSHPRLLLTLRDTIRFGEDPCGADKSEGSLEAWPSDSPTVRLPSGSYRLARWCAPWFSKSAVESPLVSQYNIFRTPTAGLIRTFTCNCE